MQKLCVLFVESSIGLRKELLSLIRSRYQCELLVTVGSSQDAIEACKSLPPDLIIWDCPQGDSSDLEAISRVRGLDPDARIIVLSLYDTAEYRESIIKAGADVFISKTASRDVLLDSVERFISPQ